ncbi:MAG: hypothetical protein JXR77_12695, partial [Lentisphaeria bacterium]|nr:hypothetical protein [Lentisphaeria bacterium]
MITGADLGNLPAGVTAHASLAAAPGDGGQALLVSAGGLRAPTAGNLTAASGTIDLRLQAPADWPVEEDRAVFHCGEQAHVHLTLLFRQGGLMAVYKGGEPYFAAVHYSAARAWSPLSWHRLTFTWQAAAAEVKFLLSVDGRLTGSSTGRLMDPWPTHCSIGDRGSRTPWRGLLGAISLAPCFTLPAEMTPGDRTVTVDATREVGTCYAFWTVANCNEPHRFTDEAYRRGCRARPFIRQVNAVYLLGGRYRDQNVWYAGLDAHGRLEVDFRGLIDQIRGMLDVGYTPWIVLDNVPYAMSDPPREHTYGNTAPPADVTVWARYVEAAVQAMVDAFGAERVASWWFRVGTEPDLNPGHWCGTREEYLRLYDHTVAAVTRVLPGATIGPGNILNPAGGQFGTRSTGNWGLDIIDHCGAGRNHATGAVSTQMDWFSSSWYGRVGQSLDAFDDAVARVRERLDRYPRFAHTPLIVGEFAVLHDERGRRLWAGDTTEWAASFYAALAARVYAHGIRHVYEWAATTAGLYHARAHVIAMLERVVGSPRLAVTVEARSSADAGALAFRQGESLCLLLYNHRPLRQPKVPETIHLVVRDPRLTGGSTWRLSEALLDAEHGVWTHAFEADCAEAGIEADPTAGAHEGSIGRTYGEAGVALFRRNLGTYRALAEVPTVRVDEPVTVGDGEWRT